MFWSHLVCLLVNMAVTSHSAFLYLGSLLCLRLGFLTWVKAESLLGTALRKYNLGGKESRIGQELTSVATEASVYPKEELRKPFRIIFHWGKGVWPLYLFISFPLGEGVTLSEKLQLWTEISQHSQQLGDPGRGTHSIHFTLPENIELPFVT